MSSRRAIPCKMQDLCRSIIRKNGDARINVSTPGLDTRARVGRRRGTPAVLAIRRGCLTRAHESPKILVYSSASYRIVFTFFFWTERMIKILCKEACGTLSQRTPMQFHPDISRRAEKVMATDRLIDVLSDSKPSKGSVRFRISKDGRLTVSSKHVPEIMQSTTLQAFDVCAVLCITFIGISKSPLSTFHYDTDLLGHAQ